LVEVWLSLRIWVSVPAFAGEMFLFDRDWVEPPKLARPRGLRVAFCALNSKEGIMASPFRKYLLFVAALILPVASHAVLGQNWTQVGAGPHWSGRYIHASAVHDGKMWILGGYDGSYRNDVWNSADGVAWTAATASASWPGRYGHSAVSHNGRLWVMGGLYYNTGTMQSTYFNDVWSSAAGTSWSQTATPAPMWTGRQNHSSVVFDGKIWVMGGEDQDRNLLRDVWYSEDGANWTQATSAAPWIGRHRHASVVFNGEIWVMGGISGFTLLNDIWHSSDGVNWTQAPASGHWSPRQFHRAVVLDDKIWVTGGSTTSNRALNDVWYSEDGVNWVQSTAAANWSVRDAHAALAYQNALWVMGGIDNFPGTNDIWFSIGGPGAPEFSPPAGTYEGYVEVELTSEPPGSEIRYTLDGEDPDVSGFPEIYIDGLPIWLEQATTIMARAYHPQFGTSRLAQADYIIAVATPEFSPPPGTYADPIDVYLYSYTSGATIHYTTDGADPTEADPIYVDGEPIRVEAVTTIRAKAFMPGAPPSGVAVGKYLNAPDVEIIDSGLAYTTDYLEAGKLVYVDRSYLFAEPIPEDLEGNVYIRTWNADKAIVEPDFLEFEVDVPCRIVVGHDVRFPAPPSWLAFWEKRADTLVTDDNEFALYSREFPYGTITLGSNRDAGMPDYISMYTVVIIPTGPRVTAARDWIHYK
jgi:hypothetical protein